MNDHSVFLVSVLCKYFSILCGDPKHSEVFAAKIQHKVYVFAPPSCFTGNCRYYVNDVLQMYREGVGIFQKDGLRTRPLRSDKAGCWESCCARSLSGGSLAPPSGRGSCAVRFVFCLNSESISSSKKRHQVNSSALDHFYTPQPFNSHIYTDFQNISDANSCCSATAPRLFLHVLLFLQYFSLLNIVEQF